MYISLILSKPSCKNLNAFSCNLILSEPQKINLDFVILKIKKEIPIKNTKRKIEAKKLYVNKKAVINNKIKISVIITRIEFIVPAITGDSSRTFCFKLTEFFKEWKM